MPERPYDILLFKLDRVRTDSEALLDAANTLPTRLEVWDDDNEDFLRLTSRVSRRLDWLSRMHRAVYDLVQIADSESLDEALERTQHLDYSAARHADYFTRPEPVGERTIRETFGDRSAEDLSVWQSFINTNDEVVTDLYTSALRALLDLAGYELVVEGLDEWGSWVKRMVVKIRRSDAPRRLLEGMTQAAQDSYTRVPAAAATRDLAEASRAALDAMGENEGCQMFDNLVVLKIRGAEGSLRSIAKELTLEERRFFRQNPAIILYPGRVLEELQADIHSFEGTDNSARRYTDIPSLPPIPDSE